MTRPAPKPLGGGHRWGSEPGGEGAHKVGGEQDVVTASVAHCVVVWLDDAKATAARVDVRPVVPHSQQRDPDSAHARGYRRLPPADAAPIVLPARCYPHRLVRPTHGATAPPHPVLTFVVHPSRPPD